jgi:hypothetical protein
MALVLKEELVLCCEGEADRQFIRKLIENRGLRPFDMPFPTNQLHGNKAFGGMLEAIRGDKANFPRIKGVLIVADSADDPATLFTDICSQIRSAGGYGVPTKLLEIARSDGHPAIAVMTLPDEATPGALESLLVREIEGKAAWVGACVDAFLRCDKIEAHSWPPEKRDKARFHSMVAALNRDDPSRAASMAFKTPNPLIEVNAACFNGVAQRIRDFYAPLVERGEILNGTAPGKK